MCAKGSRSTVVDAGNYRAGERRDALGRAPRQADFARWVGWRSRTRLAGRGGFIRLSGEPSGATSLLGVAHRGPPREACLGRCQPGRGRDGCATRAGSGRLKCPAGRDWPIGARACSARSRVAPNLQAGWLGFNSDRDSGRPPPRDPLQRIIQHRRQTVQTHRTLDGRTLILTGMSPTMRAGVIARSGRCVERAADSACCGGMAAAHARVIPAARMATR